MKIFGCLQYFSGGLWVESKAAFTNISEAHRRTVRPLWNPRMLAQAQRTSNRRAHSQSIRARSEIVRRASRTMSRTIAAASLISWMRAVLCPA